MKKQPKLSLIVLAMTSAFAYAEETLDTINVTAEEQVKQSLGVSIITEKDIEKAGVTNDISELVRTQPGVNFTSNSPTGNRGNKRQIDIRSMGPENTLILIDGKPVKSRNAERYTRYGDRNTRGDSNWVPVEEIETIEVLRGPAAARYGSGAMGGVVNIKTKDVTDTLRGSVTYYTNQPENDSEGATNRVGFNLSGPLIKDVLGFRLYGNWNKTDADDMDLNQGINGNWYNAGREGVRNKDIAGRLTWNITPEQKLTFDAGYSRQGNIYNGDTNSSNGGGLATNPSSNFDETFSLANDKAETARLYRQSYSLTHEGKWSWGENKTYFMFDKTRNTHLFENLFASSEGSYDEVDNFTNADLKTYRFGNELYIPFKLGVEHMLTVGMEAERMALVDVNTVSQTMNGTGLGTIPNMLETGRNPKMAQNQYGVFLEDNIALSDRTFVVPGIRFDYSTHSGSNWSPSLNFAHQFADHWKLKGGVARAYKTPNLYQLNPNYLVGSGPYGCPLDEHNDINSPTANDATNPTWGRSCYFRGNENLKPETSWNKEIGFEYENDGFQASLAYFHNDYRNKIIASGEYDGEAYFARDANGNLIKVLNKNVRARSERWPTYNDTFTFGGPNTQVGAGSDPARVYSTTAVYRWGNTPRAIIDGLEGNLRLPFMDDKLVVNTNMTYMFHSKDKRTGNPLSIVPKYTVNTNISYQFNDKWDANLTYTRYGKQMTRSHPEILGDTRNTLTGATTLVQHKLGSYGIFGLNVGYKFNDNFNLRVGVTNLLDKTVKRTSGTARTYNERGRAYYAGLKYSF